MIKEFKRWLFHCCIKWSDDSVMIDTHSSMRGGYKPFYGPASIRHLYFDQPITILADEQLDWELIISAQRSDKE